MNIKLKKMSDANTKFNYFFLFTAVCVNIIMEIHVKV